MSITISSARPASRAKRNGVDAVPVNIDPGAYPILAVHFFGLEPPRPVGPVAAEVVADLRFRRQVEHLHGVGPRVLAETLAHLGAKHNIQTSVERTIEHFAELEPEALQVAGGDHFWQPPIHEVQS